MGAVGGFGLLFDAVVDRPALFGNFGQVAHAGAGDQHGGARLLQAGVDVGLEVAAAGGVGHGGFFRQLLAQQAAQVGEHPADAGVVELAGDGGIHRHVFIGHLEGDAVALPLLAHVAQRILGAALVVLVQRNELGEIQHVDLFQLAGRAVVAGHHVHGEVDQIDDFRIALANAGGFHDHQVVAQALEEGDAVQQHGVGGHVLAAGGHGAHVHAVAAQRVHADAVAQQRAAGAATGGINRNHRHAHLREVGQEAVEQLVGDAGFAGAAGAGDADHRGGLFGSGPLLAQHGQLGFGVQAVFQRAEHAADGDLVFHGRFGAGRGAGFIGAGGAGVGDALYDILDHFHQAQLHAVVGVVDALDAVGFQLADFFRGDGAATAGDHADMAGVALAQHVDHVLHVFHVPALVAGQRDGIGVFLQGGAHHVFHRAVVAQVDHLRALRLDQAAHDVDRGVVAIEQAGGGDEAQRSGLGPGVRKGLGGGYAHGAGPEKSGIPDCIAPSELPPRRSAPCARNRVNHGDAAVPRLRPPVGARHARETA